MRFGLVFDNVLWSKPLVSLHEVKAHCLRFAEMCITFFHLPGADERAQGQRRRLVLTMNRDEFFARPTAPASWRNEENG